MIHLVENGAKWYERQWEVAAEAAEAAAAPAGYRITHMKSSDKVPTETVPSCDRGRAELLCRRWAVNVYIYIFSLLLLL